MEYVASPKISVVMPVYNREKYVRAAIDSIIGQTYTNWELIIVDDGSTDGTLEILQEYANQDKRIKILQNGENQGIAFSRNRGVQASTGKYIAVMDSDDISFPTRLATELEFMESHAEVSVVGSSSINIDDKGEIIGTFSYSLTPGMIRWKMIFFNPVIHPSVMMRREAFDDLGLTFREMHGAEDYDLLAKLAVQGYSICNLAEPLIYYRIHSGSISLNSPINRAFADTVVHFQVCEYCKVDFPNEWTKGFLLVRFIKDIKQAHFISKTYRKLLDVAKPWGLTKAETLEIRHQVAFQLLTIWKSQHYALKLLPNLFFAIQVYSERLIDKIR